MDQKTHVMNDDILCLIFKDLGLKDVFALQRVSQQFSRCSQGVLRTKKRVSIGFNKLKASSLSRILNRSFDVNDWHRIDITQAINTSMKGIDLTSGDRLESIVRQFRGVKYLYLLSTVISFKTLQLIVNQWPQLKNLCIHDTEVVDSNDHTITEWEQLVSKIKHIFIGSNDPKCASFLTTIMPKTSSLDGLTVRALNLPVPDITLSLLTDCLPTNMRCLCIGVTSMDSQAIDVITNKCRQIRRLTIFGLLDAVEIDLWNQWFAMICDRLKCLTELNTCLGDISAKNFAKSIVKLENLKVLEIANYSKEWIESMCFDTQEMARHMGPIVSLKTLTLRALKCSPNRWLNFVQMFPNVRKISVYFMYYRTDCEDGKDCIRCFHQCMKRVSKLPQLKHITISSVITRYGKTGPITRHMLEVFNRVDRLTIVSMYTNLIEVLIHFLTKTLANRRRVFRLILLPKVKTQLIQRMEEMNVSMPESVIVGHEFSMKAMLN